MVTLTVAVLPSPSFTVRVKTLPALKRLLFWSDAKMTKLPASGTGKLTAPLEPL